ncbi:MAG: methyltransferase domain-containing protein [Roseiflexaceae bacterium]
MNTTPYTLECTTWPGLVPALCDEMEEIGVPFVVHQHAVRLRVAQPWQLVTRLRCAQSAFVLLSFAVPRPKALLGQQYWDEILSVARDIMRRDTFTTIELDAAGADSTVMQRIIHGLADTLQLQVVPQEGELQVRIRPGAAGWDVLLRMTPRPLGTRAWRVCNYPGAVNAVVAASMVRLAGIYADDRICNMVCGSATLLIERLLDGQAATVFGCDNHAPALACAHQNVAAARLSNAVQLYDWDATHMPVADASIDLILADLPFGQLVGTHTINQVLYPALMREAQRIMSARGRMVLISHEIRLLEQSLAQCPGLQVRERMQVHVGGMAPLIVLVQQ